MISPCTHLGEAIDPSVSFGFVVGLHRNGGQVAQERRTPPPDPFKSFSLTFHRFSLTSSDYTTRGNYNLTTATFVCIHSKVKITEENLVVS
jgi:hypothetical protein